MLLLVLRLCSVPMLLEVHLLRTLGAPGGLWQLYARGAARDKGRNDAYEPPRLCTARAREGGKYYHEGMSFQLMGDDGDWEDIG